MFTNICISLTLDTYGSLGQRATTGDTQRLWRFLSVTLRLGDDKDVIIYEL